MDENGYLINQEIIETNCSAHKDYLIAVSSDRYKNNQIIFGLPISV